MSKKRLGLGEAPALRLSTTLENDACKVEAYSPAHPGRRVGVLTAERAGSRAHEGPMAVSVANVMYPGQGIGTKLYEAAARIACERYGGPLQSDDQRSPYSQGFWEKQAKKGRARCVTRCRPGDEACEVTPGVVKNRGGCVRYRLSCPAPKTLAGRRR